MAGREHRGVSKRPKTPTIREGTPFQYDSATEETPLVTVDTIPRMRNRSGSDASISSALTHYTHPQITASKSTKPKLRQVKIVILFIITLFFSVLFIINPERPEDWQTTEISINESKDDNISDPHSDPVVLFKVRGRFLATPANATTENVSLVIHTSSSKYQIDPKLWTLALVPEKDLKKSEEITKQNEFIFDQAMLKNFSYFELRITTTSGVPVEVSYQYNTLKFNQTIQVICAALILIGVYVLIIFELVHRTLAAMIGSLSALGVLSVLNYRPSLNTVINWLDYETLCLLFGMMVLVSIFSETGFFDYSALIAYKLAKGKVWPLITILCAFAGIVSAFLDNVTTILLLTPVTIRLCEVLNLDPKHILIAEVLFSNIGGTATAIGDPPNVIIVSHSEMQKNHIDFATFSLHMALGIIFVFFASYGMIRIQYRNISLLSKKDPPDISELKHEIDIWRKTGSRIMVVTREESVVKALIMQKVVTLENVVKKKLYKQKRNVEKDFKQNLAELEKKYKITDKWLLIKSSIVLGTVIILFFLYSFVEQLHLTIGWIAIIGAIWLLVLSDLSNLEALMDRVEWTTLLFFAALFALMEALTELGLIDFIGQQTSNVIENVPEQPRLAVAIILIIWVSALASSFIDNIPFTTAMVPVVITLSENPDLNLPLLPLTLALAFGACLGGNGTLIGASCNVVCAGIAEQHGYGFTFKEFFKVGFPMMLVSTLIAMCYLLICHVAFSWNDPLIRAM